MDPEGGGKLPLAIGCLGHVRTLDTLDRILSDADSSASDTVYKVSKRLIDLKIF